MMDTKLPPTPDDMYAMYLEITKVLDIITPEDDFYEFLWSPIHVAIQTFLDDGMELKSAVESACFGKPLTEHDYAIMRRAQQLYIKGMESGVEPAYGDCLEQATTDYYTDLSLESDNEL